MSCSTMGLNVYQHGVHVACGCTLYMLQSVVSHLTGDRWSIGHVVSCRVGVVDLMSSNPRCLWVLGRGGGGGLQVPELGHKEITKGGCLGL